MQILNDRNKIQSLLPKLKVSALYNTTTSQEATLNIQQNKNFLRGTQITGKGKENTI